MILQERFTNVKAAAAEAHKNAKDKKKTHFVHGAKGNYRVSDKKPEGGRHISVTPNGNEWSCTCDQKGNWNRSRLGMVSATEDEFENGIEFMLVEDDFYDDPLLEDMEREEVEDLIVLVTEGIDEGMGEDALVEMVLSEMSIGHRVRKGAPGAKKKAVGAAKKIVRGGFKAVGKAKKTRKQIKKAGGVKKWAKAKVKSKAKQVAGGVKKKVRGKLGRMAGKLKKWASG